MAKPNVRAMRVRRVSRDSILGLDISISSTGVCFYSNNLGYQTLSFGESSFKGATRLSALRSKFLDIVEPLGIKFCAIEGYAFGSFDLNKSIAEWTGLIKYELNARQVPILTIPPGTLKKWVTGKGNAKKDEMMEGARIKWPSAPDFANHDECDAYCVQRFACAYMGLDSAYSIKNCEGQKLEPLMYKQY